MKTKTYIIGMPEATRNKLRRILHNIGVGVLITLVLAACFVVGYLIGLTHFYYG